MQFSRSLYLYLTLAFVGAHLASQPAGAVVAVPIAVPTESAAAFEYHFVSNSFYVADQILSLLFPLILLLTRWGSRFHETLVRLTGGRRYLSLTLFAGGFFLLAGLLRLPLLYFWNLAYDHAIGVQGQALAEWVTNQMLGLLLPIFGMAVLALVVYWSIAKSPRRWWLWATVPLATIALLALLGEPFTQRLKPLGDTPIESKIIALAARAGVPANALVTEHCEPANSCPPGRVIGLGPSRRLILDDVLLARLPEDQLLQVVAHEAKHYAMDDNIKAFLMICSLLLAGFWLVDRLGHWMIARWSWRFGFSALGNPASLPLIVVLLTSTYLVVLPGISIFRQHVEHEADRFGLELNQDNRAAALVMVEDTKNMPLMVVDYAPLYRLFRATHPSIGDRIRFANMYHPWLEGTPLVYGDNFKL